MVVAADEQLHRFFTLAAGAGFTAGATACGFEFTHRHPLQIAGFREQHHRALIRDQVDVFQATSQIQNLGAAGHAMALTQLDKLLLDDAQHPFPTAEDVFVVGNLGDEIFVLQADLVRFKRGEPPQLHLQNRIRLHRRQPMTVLQLRSRRCGVGCGTDQGNDRIELIEGQQQAQQNVVALFRLAQQITGAPLDRLDAEVEEHLEHLAQGEQDRLAIHQRQHVGTEVALQRCELEQVVQHHLRVGIPTQLDNDPHAIAVAFVADVGNALQFLVVHHLSDAFNQRRFVGLIRQSRNNHGIPIRPTGGFDRFDLSHAAHRHRAAAT